MKFDCGESNIWEKKKESIFQQINESGAPLVLFGKSDAVNKDFLSRINVSVQYICDNDPGKWGSTLWGKEVIAPTRLQDIYTTYNVLILVPYEDEIIPQLQGLKNPPRKIFYLDLYFEENDTVSYYQKMEAELTKIYKSLGDRESQNVYEAVIRYRINRNSEYLRPFTAPKVQEYFPDVLGSEKPFLDSNEIFVDVGGFTGDTVQAFLRASDKKYSKIYAFEPDPENYKILLQNICGVPNITTFQKAIGDRTGMLRFSSGSGITARADKSGDLEVQIDTLDHILDGIPVTYIKMDLEGMECAALCGAKRLIQKYCPKLAVCTYHSNADMINVPQKILEINPDYQLYFRHYSHALVDTICYALPQVRGYY